MKIGELLVRNKLITSRQLEAALAEQRRTGEIIGEILVRWSLIRRRDLSRSLADQNRLLIAAATLAVGTLLAPALPGLATGSEKPPGVTVAAESDVVGTVTASLGRVEATAPDGKRRTVRIGDSILSGERIVAGFQSTAKLTFRDGITLQLDGGGNVVIDERVYDLARSGEGILATAAEHGFRFVAALINTNADRDVRTAAPTIGIRG